MQSLFTSHYQRIRSSGFTLIELLVVMALIAMLMTIAISTYAGVQAKGRDTKRRADVDEIRKAEELYYVGGNPTPYLAPAPNMFSDGRVPNDPKNSAPYVYYFNGGNMPAPGSATFANYIVCAQLETKGGNAKDLNGTPPSVSPSVDGFYYCRKSIQN